MRSRSGLISTEGCSSVNSSQSRCFRGQPVPRPVDVDVQAADDAPQVRALPGTRPRRDRALGDAQRRVGDHQVLGDVVHHAQAVALRAGPGGGVGRERLGGQPGDARRVAAGAGVEHPQQVRQLGDRADRRARARCPAPLLQGHGRRHPGDLLDVRRPDLLQQPPGVRRHRLEVAALRLGVQRAERERGLARPGDTGEGDQRVAGDVDVDVAQVVLGGASDVDEGVGRVGGHRVPVPRAPTRTR